MQNKIANQKEKLRQPSNEWADPVTRVTIWLATIAFLSLFLYAFSYPQSSRTLVLQGVDLSLFVLSLYTLYSHEKLPRARNPHLTDLAVFTYSCYTLVWFFSKASPLSSNTMTMVSCSLIILSACFLCSMRTVIIVVLPAAIVFWVSSYQNLHHEGLGGASVQTLLLTLIIFITICFCLAVRYLLLHQNQQIILHNQKLQRTLDDIEIVAAASSHDIRGPLTGAAWSMEKVIKQDLPAETTEQLVVIHERIKHVIDLADSVVHYLRSRDHEASYENIDLNAMLLKIFSMLPSSHQATTEIAGEIPQVKADPVLLQHVLQNLCSNSVQHNKLVHIKASCHETESHWNIAVSDNGSGIDPLVFSEINKKNTTNGLGLTISNHFVKCMKGSLTLDTDYHSGAKFNISLPKHEVARSSG
jgi:signal transduction histidine kinase